MVSERSELELSLYDFLHTFASLEENDKCIVCLCGVARSGYRVVMNLVGAVHGAGVRPDPDPVDGLIRNRAFDKNGGIENERSERKDRRGRRRAPPLR